MFARWRNLAAAAGTLCFPLAFVRASLPTDNPSLARPAACIRFQETTDESSWFRTERDSWYQRYYGDALDDPAPISEFPLTTPQRNTPADQPNAVILDFESIDENNNDPTSNECDTINCPCRDILNSEDNGADAEIPETVMPVIDLESQFFDVYTPYTYPDGTSNESSKSEPAAELTGSIEPISNDSEEAWFDESFCGDAPSQQDSAVLLNEIDAISAPADLEFEELDETEENINYDNSKDGDNYHMFYPGCDWGPYYPASNGSESSSSLLPEDVRSA